MTIYELKIINKTVENRLFTNSKNIGISILLTIILVSIAVINLNGCQDTKNIQQSDEIIEQTENEISTIEDASKPTIMILSTGGTIAGSGEEGKTTGYQSGAIKGEELISSVPELKQYANIITEEICNINSDDMTASIWIKLANRITELSKNPNIDGFVITHGTDTMEETAYFLNLTVKTEKPITITGSMRPSTAVSADGPLNLLEAVRVSANKDSSGRGVLCVFSDLIYPSRTFTKFSSYAVNAMNSPETGAIGIVRDDRIYFFHETHAIHTVQTEFDVTNATDLPEVNTVYFDVDANPNLLAYALNISEGIIVNGAGAGEYSKEFKDVLEKTNKPVMVTNHTGSGTITQSSTILPEKTVACNYLTAQKAQVLLRLSLLMYPNLSFNELLRIVDTY